MESSTTAQIVVVGLGLAGLSATWQLTKAGFKVLGLERMAHSGAIGTSSAGYTRIIRIASTDPELQHHAVTDFKEWRELETLTGRKIVTMTGGLSLGPKGGKEMQKLLKNSVGPGDEVLNAKQIMERYPAMNMAPDYVAISTKDMGFVNTKAALASLKEASEKRGAQLRYNCEVLKINEELKEITVSYKGKVSKIRYMQDLVMTTGPYSPNFKKDPTVQVIQTETIRIMDPSGLPPIFLLYAETQMYMLPHSPEWKEMKIAIHESRSFPKLLAKIRQYMPSKISQLGEVQPCFYTLRHPEKGLTIYRSGSTIWSYGFCGHGFKHGPSIGIKVRDLVQKQVPKL